MAKMRQQNMKRKAWKRRGRPTISEVKKINYIGFYHRPGCESNRYALEVLMNYAVLGAKLYHENLRDGKVGGERKDAEPNVMFQCPITKPGKLAGTYQNQFRLYRFGLNKLDSDVPTEQSCTWFKPYDSLIPIHRQVKALLARNYLELQNSSNL